MATSDPRDDEDETPVLTTPEYHLSDDDVEGMFVDYSTRAPEDWVISGPLGEHGRGPGRHFASMKEARGWAKEKYGARVRRQIIEARRFGGNRWAFLIRGEKHV